MAAPQYVFGHIWIRLTWALGFLAAVSISCGSLSAQRLPIPDRPVAAPGASAIIAQISDLSLEDREALLVAEVLSGNIPSFMRVLADLELNVELEGREYVVLLRVLPDVLSVGHHTDFLRIPLSPQAAQVIADSTHTSLLTSKISDAVWSAATLRLAPRPIPPSEAMTTVAVFADHHALIEATWPPGLPHGTIVAGIKKDVVLTPRLDDEPGRVAIYGWHGQDGVPIQPIYTGHSEGWVDYSHGVRLVSRRVRVDGVEYDLPALLEDPVLWALLSDEGAMRSARYPVAPR